MKELKSDLTVKILIAIWYLVGVAGFMILPLRPIFLWLTPFGMVMAAVVLLYFQEPKNSKSWIAFSGIAIIGFVAELIGVNSHRLFGNYEYGNALGLKLWNTPLTIGLNWLVLIYCVSAMTRKIRDNWYFPLLGASAMVVFDWLMEPVAIAIGMWNWSGQDIPLKNYTDWFLISGFLFLMIRILKIEINNRIAGVLFVGQLAFFLVLNIFMSI